MNHQEEALGALVQQAAAGDEQAFALLVEATHHDLRCFVAAYAWHVDVIDEVVQTAYVTCFCCLDAYRGGDAFLPWLKGIARNHLRQELEARRRRSRHHADRLLDLVVPSEETDAEELPAARLQECLARLGPRGRTLIDLFYRDGCSLVEIAEKLKGTRGSVAMALSRIRSSLRVCLEERGQNDG